ncbi:ATP-binding protein [Polynucleobacter sp. MWH-CaK5]|uniref:ATP-binding protein n=1 Tax=Polynucleobacter sp. MWH-CaK5 TaxID=2689107 RepID=UPI001BFD12F0|nr:ATP-binding protein [Polynucleobacter sp. MWH-CaK5]QWD89272.1 ATP-binding protein [Polynucleobacter sp. MWH-CaK5]
MRIKVGEVIEVRGLKITLRINDDSNKEFIFNNGEIFKGISIREFITIERGFKDIVCVVEGEYLSENSMSSTGISDTPKYIRKVEVKPIGYFDNNKFIEGIKYLPMIKDSVFLSSQKQIQSIFNKFTTDDFSIGNLIKENFPISIPWELVFNSHLGIFGNTGSGKSNTLTKLYTTLFDKKSKKMLGKSKFVLLDFNGEYTGNQLLTSQKNKKIYKLDSSNPDGDKLPINSNQFWNHETLSLLFKATTNTQTPFIRRVVSRKLKYNDNTNSLENYIKYTIKENFQTTSPKKETIDLLKKIAEIIGNQGLKDRLAEISWRSDSGVFHHPPSGNSGYFNGGSSNAYESICETLVSEISLEEINFFNELIIRINLQLVNDLISGYVQFEHIQPLLKRVESLADNLCNVISLTDDDTTSELLTIISLRKCNHQEIKKIIPLLVAKQLYTAHKNSVSTPPNKTVHLIIDEAHNILSQQSLREEESWKDYRLELFEEIIKEGRKFGFFLTLSSQRPADISPTIMSQIHNFFIHRLVNDKDLFLLENTISTLDTLSKNMIPNLPKGACIITGTAFDLPLVIQADRLNLGQRPDSEDVDLVKIWS